MLRLVFGGKREELGRKNDEEKERRGEVDVDDEGRGGRERERAGACLVFEIDVGRRRENGGHVWRRVGKKEKRWGE